jgi:ubiquinone/menaquinone biosynthesis C-methylase UbiE
MIKGLINIMGLKPGDTVLDPMMGSGTVLIEASLMGMNSVGVDASPFCRFMAQSKVDGLTLPLDPVRSALENATVVFEYFSAKAEQPRSKYPSLFNSKTEDLFAVGRGAVSEALPEGCEEERVRNFLLLAYLDAAGYSQRSSRKAPFDQFEAILERYLFVAEKIQQVLEGAETELGDARPLEGDARALPLENDSIDGIIFSPPYSFAIDYLENDEFHLGYLGVDIGGLRERMVGLRGRTLRRKYELYKADMNKVLAECSRVLRSGKICTIVVGTNNNQLSKILGVSAEEIQGIDDILCEMGTSHGLRVVRKLSRQITGMANTMRTEFIVMFERV